MRIRILLYIIFIFEGCIENYYPKIDDYADLLVIDGIITNEPGPYIIRLSKSSTVYDPEYIPVSGAKMVISDDFNTEEALVEIEPGVYSTDPFGIRGEVGGKYRITINTDGKTYQSNYEELEEPVEIDSVYAKIEYMETAGGSSEGLQFYLNCKPMDYKKRHFFWVPIETYKYKADVSLDFIYYGLYEFEGASSDSINVCWLTQRIFKTFIYSTKDLSKPEISKFPLHYVSTTTKKLSEKYSLFVYQYSISEKAYRYWNEIEKQNIESGSLYTRQPYQIRGNLVNINDQNDVILGYFMAAGASKKRIFVDRPQLNFSYPVCKPNVGAFAAMFSDPKPFFPALVTITNDGLAKTAPECIDCRYQGGTNIKPDFWED